MRLPARVTVLGAYVLLLLVTLAISEVAWQVAQYWSLQAFLPDNNHGAFIVRNVSICAIVSAISLRYFLMQEEQRRQVRVEAEARYQALQARIRPHFLFNSLNNIAALIGSRPQEAETAVEDLAQLFRAGLAAGERQTLLSEELDITRAYLRTEALRLGERLRVRWEVSPDVDGLPVPLLCLQPLVENAVDHGVEPIPEGGEVAIRIQRAATELVLEVENPVSGTPRTSTGAGMALDNVRQRLRIIYGERATLDTERPGGRFLARLRLPLPEPAGA
jgi:two-component system sensor histidine kinase AlgZ